MANPPRFETYPRSYRLRNGDLRKEWGWRFRDANGRITGIGGEGFTRAEDADRAARDFAGQIHELMIGHWTNDDRIPITRVEEK